MKKNILLIGGEGYIGSVTALYLLSKGYKVTSYDNLIFNNNHSVLSKKYNQNFKFIFGDLQNQKLLKKVIIENNIKVIVLLAGLVGDPITKKYPKYSKIINDYLVSKTINLVKKIKLDNFIFVSTCSNYGLITDDVIADENFYLKPLSLYAKSKVRAEKTILKSTSNKFYRPTILRFATAFGISPRMRFDLTVNEFTREMFLNKKIDVYDPDTWRPYCHVLDFARAIQKVFESDISKTTFEVFNVGNSINNATKRMIIDLIKSKIDDSKANYLRNSNDKRNYRVDFSKIEKKLSFQTKYSIEYGIDEILNFLKDGFFDKKLVNKNEYGNYFLK